MQTNEVFTYPYPNVFDSLNDTKLRIDRFMVVLTDFSFSNIIALGTRLKSRTFAAGSFPRNHEKSYRVTTNLLYCPYRCYCFSMASFPSSAYGWNNCVCFPQMEFRGLL